jgi:small subunit ribosomal protein S2
MAETTTTTNVLIDRMFKAGAHFGYYKSRRHPSIKPLIFGVKNKMEIFDLEKTKNYLETAQKFIGSLAERNAKILFIGGKSEAREAVRRTAQSLGMPYVAGRWIGGTFTNFPQIKKRVDLLETLTSQREKGELGKYTKKERLLIDREIDNLQVFFGGIASMKELPAAVIVVDPKRENIAVTEARKHKIPVIAIMGSDCDLKTVTYPVPGNDSSISSITFFLNELASSYKHESKESKK